MLDEGGRFEFTAEVLDLVDRLWCCYRAAKDGSGHAAEQLVGLCYIVAVLRQDVDAIWAQLLEAPELQGVGLAELLDEEMGPLDAERLAGLRAQLRQRGWLS